MRYTQAQIRDVLGVTVETIRHWRKVMQPLQERTGRSATFTFGDLLALGVIHRLTAGLDMAVSNLQPAALTLFTICNEVDWTRPDARFLVLTRRLGSVGEGFEAPMIDLVDAASLGQAVDAQAVAAVIPLGQIVEQLRAHLVADPDHEVSQHPLPFPPLALKRRVG
jgi:hypothetical protein